eukprot:g1550.t1
MMKMKSKKVQADVREAWKVTKFIKVQDYLERMSCEEEESDGFVSVSSDEGGLLLSSESNIDYGFGDQRSGLCGQLPLVVATYNRSELKALAKQENQRRKDTAKKKKSNSVAKERKHAKWEKYLARGNDNGSFFGEARMVTCQQCSKVFDANLIFSSSNRFCSRFCSSRYSRRRPNKLEIEETKKGKNSRTPSEWARFQKATNARLKLEQPHLTYSERRKRTGQLWKEKKERVRLQEQREYILENIRSQEQREHFLALLKK